MEAESLGLFEQQLDVGLRIHNPNEFPLEVQGIRFDLEIDGEPIARGRDDLRVTIPAGGEREVAVKARAQSAALLRQLVDADADFSYQVDGQLLLANAQADSVRFQDTTRVDLD